MEKKERPKPPRPKHRTPVELPPVPAAPLFTDFIEDEAKEEENTNTEAVIDTIEQASVEENGPKNEADEESKENRQLESNEKSKEARLSSSFVRELPLDALLSHTTSASEVELPATVQETPKPISTSVKEITPPPMYPNLETLNSLPKIVLNGDLVQDANVLPLQVEHKSIYPNIQEATMLHGENELLNEAQLLTYYQNEQLDFVDDFIDEFVKREITPRNTLHNLLAKFKETCEQIQRNEDTKKMLAVALGQTNNEVWSVEDRKVSKSGRCGDDKGRVLLNY